jgi:hypothetical protein
MKKKAISFVMFLFFLSPLAVIQAAQGGNSNGNSEAATARAAAKEERETAKEERQAAKEEKCKNVGSRIEAKMNKYENGNISVEDVHKRLKERIRNMITRLENNGIDAGKLEDDLAVLEQKINQVASSYDTFIAGLEETKTYACGESQGQFRTKLQEAKKLMANVRTGRQETMSYITKTIIPDIKALREQLKTKIEEQNQTNAD